MKKLKKFLCKIGLHYFDHLEDGTRKCRWCPKHEYIKDWDAGVMGGIDYEWGDVKK